jgi:hypothetical protein
MRIYLHGVSLFAWGFQFTNRLVFSCGDRVELFCFEKICEPIVEHLRTLLVRKREVFEKTKIMCKGVPNVQGVSGMCAFHWSVDTPPKYVGKTLLAVN